MYDNMTIRLMKEAEMDKLIEIWYKGSVIAHNFIDKEYWKSQRKEMREKYFPMAETYVICDEEEIVGFVSMVDDYLAALFIDIHNQKKGYGRRLLEFVKQEKETIQLKVYQKNKNAVQFYLNNGFVIKGESRDKPTMENEFLMVWEKK